ncbi:MAG: polyprenyl synthetase family protein [Candidatus Zixiibacteriota bacterium]
MRNQLTETLAEKPLSRRDTDELQRLLEPVKADFCIFDERIARCLEGDSPLITSIAQHLLKSKGKRIRPALLFLLSRAAGQFNEHTINASVAIELIHAATLLHDDVVDESEMRRNQETVNARWTNLISVLMGDYLFAKAFKIMSSIESLELMQAISAATERVSVGELRQIEETSNYDISEKEYLRIIADKTASLFAVSCQVGPILCRADTETKERFSGFGEALGISFQIADDLLDFVGDSHLTGKEPGNDVLTGKVTLPLIYALQNSPADESERVRAYLANGAGAEEFPRTLEFVRGAGGIEYATRRAHEICDRGFEIIRTLESSVYADSLMEIARFATYRDS